MGLATAELGYQRHDRCSVLSLTGEATQNHSGVLRQRTGEAGAREKLCRIAVVLGRGSRYHLLQGNSELVGAEGPALPDLYYGALRLYTRGPSRHHLILSFPQDIWDMSVSHHYKKSLFVHGIRGGSRSTSA